MLDFFSMKGLFVKTRDRFSFLVPDRMWARVSNSGMGGQAVYIVNVNTQLWTKHVQQRQSRAERYKIQGSKRVLINGCLCR